MSSRHLVVLPDDSARPILDAIGAASRSIRVKMFVFSDPALTGAMLASRRRGLKVRVMLNPARRSGEEDNEKTRKELIHGGIEVVDSNPDFHLTHEKSMVVDDETAFVKSLNWATKNLSGTRDYAVVTSHKHEVGEIVDCFEADWHRKRFHPGREGHLIWCPGGRDRRVDQPRPGKQRRPPRAGHRSAGRGRGGTALPGRPSRLEALASPRLVRRGAPRRSRGSRRRSREARPRRRERRHGQEGQLNQLSGSKPWPPGRDAP